MFRWSICIQSWSSFILLPSLSLSGAPFLPFGLIGFDAACEQAFYAIEIPVNRAATIRHFSLLSGG
jgi:hypothetical protein